MNDVYARMCTDMSIIISMMPNEMKNKISKKIIAFFEQNKAKDYISNINPTIPLREQSLEKETKIMLGIIYRDYLCGEEERSKLIEDEKIEIEENERLIREKYNPENLFINDIENNTKEITIEEKALTNNKDSLFVKIKRYICNLLNL